METLAFWTKARCRNLLPPFLAGIGIVALTIVMLIVQAEARDNDDGRRDNGHEHFRDNDHGRGHDRYQYENHAYYGRPDYLYAPPTNYYVAPPAPPVIDFVFPLRFR